MSRHKGKQFGVPFQPKGKGPDAMIDKNLRLTVPGDKYIEPYNLQKDLGASKSIHGRAFVPPTGSKSLGGSGTIYGLFGNPKDMFNTTPLMSQQKPPTPPVQGKRNIYVSPPKRGTYGFPIQDRSIGGTRFDFVPDEYCRGRLLDKELKKEARARIPKPFISTGRSNKGFEPMSSYMGPSAPQSQSQRAQTTPSVHHSRAFKAPNPPQKGQGYGTLGKFEYIPNPSLPPKESKQPTGVFKPAGGHHKRLSMWSPSPYEYAPRPPPNNDIAYTS
ncbi:hypothetical protein DUNSADRAFT_3092 [Dunaliella salina]|uniref:Cilia-and flagella-associated protein 96 n=1 Tax=Dunaliella salina TaxID=3046 RepID=A0ABQ7GUL1_DUNSA|nr:hypothetical protein DUNSADRAFT_3092 [Dunaliella salina]|eukprot:KAF5838296.1 hypothetical protein DUNSADRAFT_3092 [Dunaliella salina]